MNINMKLYDLQFNGVKKYMDATLVLKNITFLITGGEKVGIVGENGSGKTTILKLIAGKLKLNHCAGYPYAPVPPGYDEGWVIKSDEAACAYLEQIPEYPKEMRVIDVLKLAFKDIYDIENKLRSLEEDMVLLQGKDLEKALQKYSEYTQIFEVKGGYEITEKLNRVCKGLKFEEDYLNREFKSLSGGEKTTVILGKLLIDNPDILLLDEPTNHLDMDSVEWLEDYLKNYKGTVVIVSHDRYFLDHVVTKIIEIEDKTSDTFNGNYSEYVRLKEEKLRIQYNNYKDQQKKINSMKDSVKELREWALKADNNKFFKRAASIQNKLDRMEKVDRPALERQNMKLSFKKTERSGNTTIQVTKLTKYYEDRCIFRDADLFIQYGERAALIGPNGCGKTTFLRMLLGEEYPDRGNAVLGANVKIAYLPQNITFANEELTLLECFREDLTISEGAARGYLAKYMFYGGNVFKKIKHLSGGERIRLYLSKLLYDDVNLLILDEPTNHLDTTSIETLEEALAGFKGTIFLISHDRYFINKIAERVIAVEGYAFGDYDGNYDYYKQVKDELKQREDNQVSDLSKPGINEKIKEKEKIHKDTKIQVKKNSQEKTEIQRNQDDKQSLQINLEDMIEKLEKELDDIEGTINATGSSDNVNLDQLNQFYIQRESLKAKLEAMIQEWVSDQESNA